MAAGEQIRIGVIFGGRSGEHAVSLMSARSVLGALDPQKYAITQIGITRSGAWLAAPEPQVSVLDAFLTEHFAALVPVGLLPDPAQPGLRRLDGSAAPLALDVVFPVLHGTFGEDGTLQGLLEMADLAYVGPGVLAAALAMDKAAFKDVMRAHGVPVLESVLVLRSELEADAQAALRRCEEVAPYPLFTKPANLGSSVGITKCRSRADLLEGLMEAAQFDRRVLVERGINGREIEVSVLGNEDPDVSMPGEIIPHGEFYTYESKYHDDASQLLIPAPISAETAETVRDYARRAYKAIDGAGMARADFLLDRDTGEVFLNEINTIPGFTRISMYPKLWEAAGLQYPALVDRLVQHALERKMDRDRTVREYKRVG